MSITEQDFSEFNEFFEFKRNAEQSSKRNTKTHEISKTCTQICEIRLF